MMKMKRRNRYKAVNIVPGTWKPQSVETAASAAVSWSLC